MKNSKLALSRIEEKHDVRNIMDGFETFDEANNERKIRIKMLYKGGSKGEKKLASILENCRRNNRCDCAACPVCARRYRIRLIGNEMRIFGRGIDTHIINLIIHDRLVASSRLLSLDIKQMMWRLNKQIKRSGLRDAICVGGFEIKYCYGRKLWIPHFHLIVRGSSKAEREKFRKRFFKENGIISRPMKVQKVKNPIKQYSYCLKYQALYKKKVTTKSGISFEKNSRLEIAEHNSYLMLIGKYHVKDLVFKCGAKSEGETIRILNKK